MGSLSCSEMRQLEECAFKQGATPEGLMEKAGHAIAAAILRRFPEPGTAIACIGSGNNGGDALVAIRYLADAGWKIGIVSRHATTDIAALPRKKLRELGECPHNQPLEDNLSHTPLVLLDGMLGIGAKGPLREPLDGLADWMNTIRLSHGAYTVAMDIPSGINGDSGEVYDGAVTSDLTLTVGVPKRGLFASAAVDHVGAIESVPLTELPEPTNNRPRLNDVHSLGGVLARRPHDFHKGNAGRVGILAGSRGMLGAAVLCATGALRGGAGLVTAFADEEIYPLLTAMMPAEVMLRPIRSLLEIRDCQLDAMAVGPGLGSAADGALLDLLKSLRAPTVIDADGLNRIAAAGVAGFIQPNTTLTPHPGEMARLFPEWADIDRFDAVRKFTDLFPGATLLLKGARSLVTQSGSPVYVNGTGNPGMASGGQGDVLTGVMTALLAQGVEPLHASRLGAWLCGRAAELAISHGKASIQSLTASDVTDWLGMAFRELSV